MDKTDITTVLKSALNARNNPTDLKAIIIGKTLLISAAIFRYFHEFSYTFSKTFTSIT